MSTFCFMATQRHVYKHGYLLSLFPNRWNLSWNTKKSNLETVPVTTFPTKQYYKRRKKKKNVLPATALNQTSSNLHNASKRGITANFYLPFQTRHHKVLF